MLHESTVYARRRSAKIAAAMMELQLTQALDTLG
jgi:hypothetical protein